MIQHLSRWRSVTAALALIALLTGCGAGEQSTASASTPAEPAEPPQEVSDAFCDLLDARARLAAGEIGVAYHAAQLGELEEAVSVSSEIAIPALEIMSTSVEVIEAWQPARPFAAHADPLIREFTEAASAFVEDPDQETFDRTDVAGQTLRDDLLAGDFARVGIDLFQANCG